MVRFYARPPFLSQSATDSHSRFERELVSVQIGAGIPFTTVPAKGDTLTNVSSTVGKHGRPFHGPLAQ